MSNDGKLEMSKEMRELDPMLRVMLAEWTQLSRFKIGAVEAAILVAGNRIAEEITRLFDVLERNAVKSPITDPDVPL